MSSATYQIFRDAILNQQQVVCVYQGHRRELCPIIIGHTNGAAAAPACRRAASGGA
jgi:hypothetical protein